MRMHITSHRTSHRETARHVMADRNEHHCSRAYITPAHHGDRRDAISAHRTHRITHHHRIAGPVHITPTTASHHHLSSASCRSHLDRHPRHTIIVVIAASLPTRRHRDADHAPIGAVVIVTITAIVTAVTCDAIAHTSCCLHQASRSLSTIAHLTADLHSMPAVA